MVTPNSLRCINDRFGVGNATVWRSTRRIVNALYSLVNIFIKWPSKEEAKETWQKVKERHGFPIVIGAIDGTHIKIAAPKENHEAYINRKAYHSLQLQAVCDNNLKFLHCYCGEVGSVHDMRVFSLSGFTDMLNEENFPDSSHLLGDSAYGLSKYLLVPFKDNGHQSKEQVRFNIIHSSARMMIERSFGLLKGRYRSIIDKLPMTRTDLIPRYVIACCILHNICIIRNDLIEIPIIVNESNIANNDTHFNICNDNLKEEGIRKRDAIMYCLLINLKIPNSSNNIIFKQIFITGTTLTIKTLKN
ncbi:uncharacterized protein [Prorops nasuta]|uniref:uncharacterized protein n=1 Tax=Prorops nasuta TaxID=863751 RepID=UPI0034CE4653